MTDAVVTKTPAQVAAELQASNAAKLKQEQDAKAAQASANLKSNAAPSASQVLATKLKDAQLKDAATVQKGLADTANITQQTASPFMPGAPAKDVASAGVAPSSVVINIPPISHSDDIPRSEAEQAILDAQRPPVPPGQPTKPTMLSSKHVLFHSTRSNMGASTPTGIVRFRDGYAQTDDLEQIQYLKDNAVHFGISPA